MVGMWYWGRFDRRFGAELGRLQWFGDICHRVWIDRRFGTGFCGCYSDVVSLLPAVLGPFIIRWGLTGNLEQGFVAVTVMWNLCGLGTCVIETMRIYRKFGTGFGGCYIDVELTWLWGGADWREIWNNSVLCLLP